MNLTDIRFAAAIAAMALLSACGGSSPAAADNQPVQAAAMVNVNAPVADCEAEGCNRPRIIDGLAEQYRAGAAAEQARAADPVQAAQQAEAGVSAAPGAVPDAPAAAGAL